MVISCQNQPSDYEFFALESILQWRLQLQRETAAMELTLPRNMWIMDHFHSISHAFTQVKGHRARVETSVDVKLSMA